MSLLYVFIFNTTVCMYFNSKTVYKAKYYVWVDIAFRFARNARKFGDKTALCLCLVLSRKRFWLFLNTYYIVKYNNQMIIDK